MRNLGKILTISCLLGVSLSAQASAANATGGFASVDPELSTCRDLLNADRSKKPWDDKREALLNWIGGFITAYNAKTPGVTNVTEKFHGQGRTNVVIEALKVCQTANPDTWISRVVLDVLDGLKDDLAGEGHKEWGK